MKNILLIIERAGNKLPHPSALFIIFCGVIIILSALASSLGLQSINPINQTLIEAKNLLSREGVQFILGSAVSNFITFAPVGTALVAILGIGVAEHSGLLGALIKGLVKRTPHHLLTMSIVLCGVMSSLASDAGYVVLIPLAGIIFLHAGKNPIAGIAVAFAGVSAGYSANLIVGPLDVILAGLSQEAAQLIDEDYSVDVTANYYFILISTFLITVIASLVCKFVTEKQTKSIHWNTQTLNKLNAQAETTFINSNGINTSNVKITRGLKYAAAVLGFIAALIILAIAPASGWLRGDNGSIITSPLTQSIVVIISLTAALCGVAFGVASGRYNSWKNCIEGMEENIATLAGYLVLMFFAAQFVSYFKWSQLGTILAISGANGLSYLNLPLPLLLITFVFLAGFINLFVGSASAKWALLAPIFIPMFMLTGITPEATQMAYRIGDSSTNIITPLMPYFGVVIAFFHHYNKNLGSGTIMALMLPYSIALILSWVALLGFWLILGLPLGPNSHAFIMN